MYPLPGFGLTNYRCFGEDGVLINPITKVTVLIGKNNSGKSTVIRALDVIAKTKSPVLSRELLRAEIDCHQGTTSPMIASVMLPLLRLLPGTSKNSEYYAKVLEFAPETLQVCWSLDKDEDAYADELQRVPVPLLNQMLNGLNAGRSRDGVGDLPLEDCIRRLGPKLRRLAHEELDGALQGAITIPISRQIRGLADAPVAGEFDGHAIIPELRRMQHPPAGQEQKRQTFNDIEKFAGEMLNDPKLTLEITENDQLLVHTNGVRLPLDSFGTGVHHIVLLCAALAMHGNRIIRIEEPETHLHPDLQRKFLRFIVDKTKNSYILTTHSNVFLDAFPGVSVYHLVHDGKSTRVKHVDASQKARDVLNDMGYQASSLIQANGIIWVEGPSDRIYLNKWLSLVAPDLKEGIHYAVAFYGGKVLAHFSTEDDPVDDLVQVLRINRNAMWMMDRDGDDETKQLNKSKGRIIGEIGEASCWITKGREVENYLSSSLLKRWLKNKHNIEVDVTLGENDRIGDVVEAATKPHLKTPIKYDSKKPAYSRKICDELTKEDLDVLDLSQRLNQVVEQIRAWNQMG